MASILYIIFFVYQVSMILLNKYHFLIKNLCNSSYYSLVDMMVGWFVEKERPAGVPRNSGTYLRPSGVLNW